MTELVYLKNDEAVCDSLQVAEKFHKEHRNVLQNIDNLIFHICNKRLMEKRGDVNVYSGSVVKTKI